MRPSPPLQVTIERFEVWRAAVCVTMLIVSATTALWLATLHADALGASRLARWGAGLLTLVGVASAASLVVPTSLGLRSIGLQAVSLRWDGQRWHLGTAATVGNEPRTGDLRVAIDAGVWMLLRFDADVFGSQRGRERSTHWLPVQRRGLESVWHGLRCAVYSPRPKSGELPDAAVSASTRSHPAE